MSMNEISDKLLIVTGIYPPDIGGPATHLAQLLPYALSRGVQISVVTLGAQSGIECVEGITVTRISRSLGKLTQMMKLFGALWRGARDVSLMYVHDISSVGLVAYVVSRLTNTPYVLRIGGDFVWEQAYERGATTLDYLSFQGHEPFPYTIRRWIASRITQGAERVIVPSEFLKSVVEAWGADRDRIIAVANAVDETTDAEVNHEISARIQECKKRHQRVLISSGRFVRWKHFDRIIRAMPHVSEACLFVIGAGPQEDALRTLVAELGVDDRVFIIGAIPRAHLRHVLENADAFILLSEGETFSFVSLEAYLLGTPLVFARSPALEEIFGAYEGKGVTFVEESTAESIATTLKAGKLYQRSTDATRAQVRETYSLSGHLEAIWGIIEAHVRENRS